MAQYPPPLNYDGASSQFIFDDWAYSQQTTSYNTAVSLIEQSKKEILGDAPQTLDSLKEISDAINTNPSFGAETISALGQTVKLTGNQNIAGNKVFTNNVTINGTFSNSGNTTLGDATSDNLVVNSSVKFYNDIQFGVNGGNDDKITLWGQSQFQNKSCFRDSMLNKGEKFYSEGGLYLGKYGGSGTGVLAVPTDVGANGGFRFLNIENATGNIVNEPLQIFKEGNTKFNFDMLLNGRGTFQGGAVFTDNINAYAGVTDKYATQGLYLGKFSNGRAVFASPNNGTDNGFQFCNMDSSGNILNSPFYITQQGACVVNSKLQINGNLEVVDNTTITLPTDSVAQSAINGLTNDLSLKADNNAVVHLAGDETITGYKKIEKGVVIGDETNNAAGFEPQQNGLLYCRSGLDVVAGGNANTITGGLQVNGGLVCSDISGRNFTIAQGGTMTLPNNVISDGALSSNIPKKDAVNTYSNQNIFTGNIVVADCSMALLPSSTLIMPDNFISQTKIKDINQFIKTTESNLFQNNVVLSFEGGVSNLSQIKNGYFETIFRDPGISPPALLPGQEFDPTYNHTNTFTTDYGATTTNKLQNLTLKGGDLVIDAGGEFFLNGAKGMTIEGGEIIAYQSLMKIDGIECNKILSKTKLQINSGLNLQQDEEVIDGVTIPLQRSDLTGAGVIEGQDLQATTIVFTDTINSISAVELNYLDNATSNIQSQIDLRAPLESPTLTGIPTCPTAISTTNTEQIASTAFVKTQISDLLGGAGPSIDTLLELNTVLAQADSDLSTSLTALIGTKVSQTDYNSKQTLQDTAISTNTTNIATKVSQTSYDTKQTNQDTAISNNTTLINTKVGLSAYNTKQTSQDTSISNNANAISDNTTLINTKVGQSAYDNKQASQDTLISNNTTLINTKVSLSDYNSKQILQDTSISNNATAISDNTTLINTKVSQSDYDNKQASQDTLISNNTTLINTKVSLSDYDTKQTSQDTNISNNASAIGSNATAINTKVSQTAYDLKQTSQDTLISNNITSINLKAPIENANFTGIPTAPTAISSSNTTQIATTAFVKQQINDLVGGAGASIDTLLELSNVLTQADNDLSSSLTSLIGTKVSQTAYDAKQILQDSDISTNATNISNNASAINSKVSQSDYDAKQASQDTAISNNTTLTNTKVSQTTYDAKQTLQDTNISTNATNIATNSTAINTKVSQTDYDIKQSSQDLLIADNTTAITALGTDVGNNNNLIITNANNILLKVNTSTYDTEKAVQNTNISNNASAIASNTTAIASKLSTATYNSDKATLDALIATKTDTNYVDTAISNLVNGAGDSLNTLNELATALGNDPNFATTITTQIGTKLATATYTANKTATDNRLDAIESVDSQQLNLSGGTITGDFVSRQTVNMMEVLNTATVSGSAVSLNYSLGSVFYVTIPSATNFEVQITNCNPASSASTTNTISLIINTGTYEAFANTCKINGLTRALTFSGGAVDITGASQVLQTISVVYSGSSSVPVAVMSSVVPFSTLA